MKMTRLNIQLPVALKVKLDSLKSQGTSAAGLIRHLLHQYFSPTNKEKEVRGDLRGSSSKQRSHEVGNEQA
jgi:hypothetical protein